MLKTKSNRLTAVGGESPTNDGADTIDILQPYIVEIEIEGTSDLLFHRWSNEAVKEKADARKGSAAKKSDNVESYLYRDKTGAICLPGEYVRMACIGAARYRQDPRSSRKSASDLYKAGIIALTQLASLGKDKPDFEDRRRVVIQRAAITRCRPAFLAGWKCKMQFQINLPEYISIQDFRETLTMAGRLVGVGDFRPSFGRFQIVSCKVLGLS